MKFISKSSRLRIVLRQGLPAQPLTWTPARSMISVQFVNWVADVSKPEYIELMKKSPAFGSDFIAVDEKEVDPYRYYRQEVEPDHIISEMPYGSFGKNIGSPKKNNLTPEMKQALDKIATEMAQEKIKELLPEILKGLAKEANSRATEASEEVSTTTDEVADEEKEEEIGIPTNFVDSEGSPKVIDANDLNEEVSEVSEEEPVEKEKPVQTKNTVKKGSKK